MGGGGGGGGGGGLQSLALALDTVPASGTALLNMVTGNHCLCT